MRVPKSRFTRNRVGALVVSIVAGSISVSAQPATTADDRAQTLQHLHRFDQLDFDAFSGQDWELFNEIHCADVVVKFPDGRETKGIEQHQKDIAGMFVGTPDMRVSAHPVSFGSGEWTATTPNNRASAQSLTSGQWTATVGILEATFTEPMPFGDRTIQPTGKKLRLPMMTVAHWKNGCIAEEQLFWDNAAYMQQLGIGQ